MAIARPIRLLAAAFILMCVFFVFEIRKGQYDDVISSGKLVNGMKTDPLLKRTLFIFIFPFHFLFFFFISLCLMAI